MTIFRREKRKQLVWLVDDLEKNRNDFLSLSDFFDVRPFENTSDVVDALKEESRKPDALLCDVLFYPQDKAQAIEEEVMNEAESIRKLASKFDADKHADGITLAEQIMAEYGSSFPIFAYTSKGPYLLGRHSFERIQRCGMRWLFKEALDDNQLKMAIHKGIEEHERIRGNALERLIDRTPRLVKLGINVMITLLLIALGLLAVLLEWHRV